MKNKGNKPQTHWKHIALNLNAIANFAKSLKWTPFVYLKCVARKITPSRIPQKDSGVIKFSQVSKLGGSDSNISNLLDVPGPGTASESMEHHGWSTYLPHLKK